VWVFWCRVGFSQTLEMRLAVVLVGTGPINAVNVAASAGRVGT